MAEYGESIRCLLCMMRSYNPNDVEHKYCGNCHQYLMPGQFIVYPKETTHADPPRSRRG